MQTRHPAFPIPREELGHVRRTIVGRRFSKVIAGLILGVVAPMERWPISEGQLAAWRCRSAMANAEVIQSASNVFGRTAKSGR